MCPRGRPRAPRSPRRARREGPNPAARQGKASRKLTAVMTGGVSAARRQPRPPAARAAHGRGRRGPPQPLPGPLPPHTPAHEAPLGLRGRDGGGGRGTRPHLVRERGLNRGGKLSLKHVLGSRQGIHPPTPPAAQRAQGAQARTPLTPEAQKVSYFLAREGASNGERPSCPCVRTCVWRGESAGC